MSAERLVAPCVKTTFLLLSALTLLSCASGKRYFSWSPFSDYDGDYYATILRTFDEEPIASSSSEVYRYVCLAREKVRVVRIEHSSGEILLTLKVWGDEEYAETIRSISQEEWREFLQIVRNQSFWLSSTSEKIEYATFTLPYELDVPPGQRAPYSAGDTFVAELLEASFRGRMYHAVDGRNRQNEAVTPVGEHMLLLAGASEEQCSI